MLSTNSDGKITYCMIPLHAMFRIGRSIEIEEELVVLPGACGIGGKNGEIRVESDCS